MPLKVKKNTTLFLLNLIFVSLLTGEVALVEWMRRLEELRRRWVALECRLNHSTYVR